MPAGVLIPTSDVEKLDDTLMLLSKLGNPTEKPSAYPLSRNENHNNGTQSPVPSGFELENDSAFDPEVLYSRVLKLHRSGRVSKKSVNINPIIKTNKC